MPGRLTLTGILLLSWLSTPGCLFGDEEARRRDLAVTEAVQRALADDEDANLERVDVQVHDGIVYLDGELQQFEQKMRAGELARGVEGVNKVFNKIEVEP